MSTMGTSDSNPGAQGATPEQPERLASASTGLIVGLICAIGGAGLFVWLADEVMASVTQALDARIEHFFHVHANPTLHQIMVTISIIASGPGDAVLLTIAGIYFLWRRYKMTSIAMMILAAVGESGLNELLKRLFHRVRPEPIYYHLGYSFPSGHAMSSMVVYGALAYLVAGGVPQKWRIVVWATAMLMILLVGFSRIYLGAHYFSDVLGGYLAGAIWLWGCITAHQLFERRRSLRRAKQPV